MSWLNEPAFFFSLETHQVSGMQFEGHKALLMAPHNSNMTVLGTQPIENGDERHVCLKYDVGGEGSLLERKTHGMRAIRSEGLCRLGFYGYLG